MNKEQKAEQNAARAEIETVDMIASGYEWVCPACDKFNHEIEILNEVTCRRCHELFETNPAEHA